MHKICKIIGDLCTSSSEFKNHYFKEVVGASFSASSFVKSCISCTYRLLASESDFVLHKDAMQMLLDISFQKFESITKNHSTVAKSEHGAKGISFDRLGAKVLKTQAISFIRELAEHKGETHAVRFV